MNARIEEDRDARRGEQEEMKRLTGLLECREEEVRALEGVKEKLEKKLVLGDEFVEVTEEDVPAAAIECAEKEEEGFVVQEEEVDCFADEFEAVDVDEDGEGLDTLNGAPEFKMQ